MKNKTYFIEDVPMATLEAQVDKFMDDLRDLGAKGVTSYYDGTGYYVEWD